MVRSGRPYRSRLLNYDMAEIYIPPGCGCLTQHKK